MEVVSVGKVDVEGTRIAWKPNEAGPGVICELRAVFGDGGLGVCAPVGSRHLDCEKNKSVPVRRETALAVEPGVHILSVLVAHAVRGIKTSSGTPESSRVWNRLLSRAIVRGITTSSCRQACFYGWQWVVLHANGGLRLPMLPPDLPAPKTLRPLTSIRRGNQISTHTVVIPTSGCRYNSSPQATVTTRRASNSSRMASQTPSTSLLGFSITDFEQQPPSHPGAPAFEEVKMMAGKVNKMPASYLG
ncbi:hypothetical protein DFP72DRAFT_857032 [Ephemerocybe angulata]|uniref:Uncharacterized protein n=1 Tax=Ephemerocybe angulata TaxID=980116 RepID=A0A8H6HFJ6_9AGAR|nr:hypothetical protein DFP72DRAFT_857032 [Tulosesus angulatus]